jgi:hypothetical protein
VTKVSGRLHHPVANATTVQDDVRPTKPATCPCGNPVDDAHWGWQTGDRYRFGGTWRCRVQKYAADARHKEVVWASPERRAKRRAAEQAYFARNAFRARFKSYRNMDKYVYGGASTVARDVAFALMASACHYCKVSVAGGLDRVDSNFGHVDGNVVACCEKCNNVLGDLPPEAKALLAEGLARIRAAGLFENWTIPTKRNVRGRKSHVAG